MRRKFENLVIGAAVVAAIACVLYAVGSSFGEFASIVSGGRISASPLVGLKLFSGIFVGSIAAGNGLRLGFGTLRVDLGRVDIVQDGRDSAHLQSRP